MSVMSQRDLERVERELVALAAMAEEMIAKACAALLRRDVATAREVIAMDLALDAREVQIEEECLKILAIHQPLATSLRRAMAVLRINVDLERIGDLAVNIAEGLERRGGLPALHLPSELEEMATLAGRMVHDALDAFLARDVARAREICRRDDRVDAMAARIHEGLLARAREVPTELDGVLLVMRITHELERVADHATNIAEDALYLVEGRIARHARRRIPAENHSSSSHRDSDEPRSPMSPDPPDFPQEQTP